MVIIALLGLSVGALQGEDEDAQRALAYRCDVTYGTACEFGFDYLRDRLKLQRAREAGQMDFTDPPYNVAIAGNVARSASANRLGVRGHNLRR